jgi:hypothetical protein
MRPSDSTGQPAESTQTIGWWEVGLVLALSLGQSAVYSVISLIAKLTADAPLAQQRATLNAPLSPRPYLDLTYQIAGVGFTLVPVLLAGWLLRNTGERRDSAWLWDRVLGGGWLRQSGYGFGLAALIGLPGLGLYVVGNALGITAQVVPAALAPYWWTAPVLVLQAVKNAVLEELIVVGYLADRLPRLGLGPRAQLWFSAVLRGSYHLYQGFGSGLGNLVMGAVFFRWYQRQGRLLPLLIAHTVLDLVSFLGGQYLDPGLLDRLRAALGLG